MKADAVVSPNSLCGTFEGTRAFVVPTRRKPLVRGLIFNVIMACLFLIFLVVGALDRLFAGLFAAFFAYLVWATWRSLASGAAYFLTERGLVVKDGGGSLGVAWDDVERFEPTNQHQKTKGFRVVFAQPSLRSTGAAQLWRGVNRQMGAEFILRPASHVGGIALTAGLLDWCMIPSNRHRIGTLEGASEFLARGASRR